MSQRSSKGQAIGAILGEAGGVALATAFANPELAPAFGILGAAAGGYVGGKMTSSHSQHKTNKQNQQNHPHNQ